MMLFRISGRAHGAGSREMTRGLSGLRQIALAGVLAICLPLAAPAQETTPETPPDTPPAMQNAAPDEAAPASAAAPATRPAGQETGGDSTSGGAETPSADAGAPESPATDAGSAMDSDAASQAPSTASESAGADEPAPTGDSGSSSGPAQNEAQPAPAFTEDPAGAVSSMLDGQRRDDIPHDLSPWGMFLAADWVVKSVMIGLALASVATWTVLLVKTLVLTCARFRARKGLALISRAGDLPAAVSAMESRGGPAASMVRSAASEIERSAGVLEKAGNAGVKERVGSRLARIQAGAGRRLSRGTGILATIGAIAPFVGLFGTVWGIMNAFIGISEANTTNLAVVAPGIAEALLATAIGLVAAIPAVVIYNAFARAIAGHRHLLADIAAGVEQHVSFELDRRDAVRGTGEIAAAAE